jgi:hypothetical protein
MCRNSHAPCSSSLFLGIHIDNDDHIFYQLSQSIHHVDAQERQASLQKVLYSLPIQLSMCRPPTYSTQLSEFLPIPQYLLLQEVIRNRFLRRHTPRILRRGFKNAVSPPRPIPIFHHTIIEHAAQSPLPIRPGITA